jgi:beta-glucosidase
MSNSPPSPPFLWGAGTSAHQVEGGTTGNDWAEWAAAGRLPHGDSAALGCDHWNRMEEDLGWMEALGLTAYRFSVEWSRVEPRPGVLDAEALDRYAWLAAECRRRGIEPVVTLHHFTNPSWFAAGGGFLAQTGITAFATFAERVAARLGSDVAYWITFNEPNVYVSAAYIAGRFPPGRRSLAAAIRVSRNIQSAHRAVYTLLHRGAVRRPVSVGIALQMLEVAPVRRWNLPERALAAVLDRFLNESWPRDLMPRHGARQLDFLGVNYYTTGRLRLSPVAAARGGYLLDLMLHADEGRRSDLGWPIEPDGLGRALMRASRHGLPLIVTENGVADGRDALRESYLREHIAVIGRHRAAGGDVRGYLHWSLMDNWEWLEGYAARFGLLEVDRATLARRPRASALVYRDIIAAAGGAGPTAEVSGSMETSAMPLPPASPGTSLQEGARARWS